MDMTTQTPATGRFRTTTLLAWGLVALMMAALVTLWTTYSLVTYDLGSAMRAYFMISFAGTAAVALTALAVRQFFRSPAEGSREVQTGRLLLGAGAAVTVISLVWLVLIAG